MSDSTESLRFREHDFAANLARHREFLSEQDTISDYDINGSVIDTIISALAETTEKNAITANALFSEGFINTAVIRTNIAQHAAHFGYTPYSINAAKAVVDVTVTADLATSPPSTLTLDKGTTFSSTGNNDTLLFTTIRAYTAQLIGNQYTFSGVELYQGVYGSRDIFIDDNLYSQVYSIDIDDIDTSLLEVYVQRTVDSLNFDEWSRATDSISVDSTSQVWFLQELKNGRFGLAFGDGTIGAKIPNKSIVRVVYFKTAGTTANGFKTFTFKFVPNDHHLLNTNDMTASVVTIERAAGGFDPESDASVKRNAPRAFVSQNRAVTVRDYEDQLRQRFPYINSVAVWSGLDGNGENDQLGRVYIAATTDRSQYLTSSQRDEIKTEILESFGIAGILPVIVDADNTYVDIVSTVQVSDLVFLRSSAVQDKVSKYINTYFDDELDGFDSEFIHSQFVGGIDDLDQTISSNLATVTLHKRVVPTLRQTASFEFSFHNPISNMHSNSFLFGDNEKKVIIRAADSGILSIYESASQNEVLVQSAVGVVDFETGDVTVNDINVFKANDVTRDIRFFASPDVPNIKSSRHNILVGGNVSIDIERK